MSDSESAPDPSSDSTSTDEHACHHAREFDRPTLPESERILERSKRDLWEDLHVVIRSGRDARFHIPQQIIGEPAPLCTTSRPEIEWQVKPKSVFNGHGDDLCTSCVQAYNERQRRGAVTDKQFAALWRCFTRGWYDAPKQTTLREVAPDLGIQKSALADRVRRGHRSMILQEAHRRGVLEYTDALDAGDSDA